jgi:4-amino-4-deoxy-L-arabinose transferase-like glycosyltransferase
MFLNNFIPFSDSAKFADIARNLVQGLGYGDSFTFWGNAVFSFLKQNIFPATWVPPVMPFSIAAFFKIFGVSDFAVIATSFFYFILTLIFVFLLAKKIFKSNLVGILSTIVVGFNNDLINYAVNGASESPFIFEIVAASYFVSLKKKWGTVTAILLMILMYFTRPQAFIYIAGLILYYLLQRFSFKRSVLIFAGISLLALFIDRFLLVQLGGKYFIYSVTTRGMGSALSQAGSSVTSNALRGDVFVQGSGIVQVFKNVFYNLYNFFKLFPQIMSPYLFSLFAIGLFMKAKNRVGNSFKISVVFMAALTFLVAAAGIPFFRYLHPVVPLIYIVAVGTLVETMSKFEILNPKEILNSKLQITKNIFVILVSTFLILLFGVGQTLGVVLLDSRFERNTHNVDKPPVYVVLSQILKDNTNSSQIAITNLDTWGSWYGERKTVWFPIEPKQIIDPATGRIPFDAIYLTSYLIDDENYYMGKDWRSIFSNPKDSKKWTCEGCSEIAKEFILKGVYKISSQDNYEREDTTAMLLIKK